MKISNSTLYKYSNSYIHNDNLIYTYIYIYIYIYVTMGSKSTFECMIELCGFVRVEDGAVASLFHTLCYVNDQTLIGNGVLGIWIENSMFWSPLYFYGPIGKLKVYRDCWTETVCVVIVFSNTLVLYFKSLISWLSKLTWNDLYLLVFVCPSFWLLVFVCSYLKPYLFLFSLYQKF